MLRNGLTADHTLIRAGRLKFCRFLLRRLPGPDGLLLRCLPRLLLRDCLAHNLAAVGYDRHFVVHIPFVSVAHGKLFKLLALFCRHLGNGVCLLKSIQRLLIILTVHALNLDQIARLIDRLNMKPHVILTDQAALQQFLPGAHHIKPFGYCAVAADRAVDKRGQLIRSEIRLFDIIEFSVDHRTPLFEIRAQDRLRHSILITEHSRCQIDPVTILCRKVQRTQCLTVLLGQLRNSRFRTEPGRLLSFRPLSGQCLPILQVGHMCIMTGTLH